MSKIYVIGIGPGDISMMTAQAEEAIKKSDVIVGYRVYTGLVKELCAGKQVIESGMTQERERCEKCADLAQNGSTVALICSGDAGVYGMASLMLEVAEATGIEDIEVIPGVTAALSGAALLGAPIGHDFCVISLSDRLTPWDIIEKRLISAARADFCIVLYNPASRGRPDHLVRASKVMLTYIPADRICGLARNVGREGSSSKICTLGELRNEDADMFTTVFIGNSQTRICDGKMVTPRGYKQ